MTYSGASLEAMLAVIRGTVQDIKAGNNLVRFEFPGPRTWEGAIVAAGDLPAPEAPPLAHHAPPLPQTQSSLSLVERTPSPPTSPPSQQEASSSLLPSRAAPSSLEPRGNGAPLPPLPPTAPTSAQGTPAKAPEELWEHASPAPSTQQLPSPSPVDRPTPFAPSTPIEGQAQPQQRSGPYVDEDGAYCDYPTQPSPSLGPRTYASASPSAHPPPASKAAHPSPSDSHKSPAGRPEALHPRPPRPPPASAPDGWVLRTFASQDGGAPQQALVRLVNSEQVRGHPPPLTADPHVPLCPFTADSHVPRPPHSVLFLPRLPSFSRP